MKPSFPAIFFLVAFVTGFVSFPSGSVHASDDCPTSVSTPTETKIAVGFGYAVYSDLVHGSVMDSTTVCLDESGNLIEPDVPMICSFSDSDGAHLSYESDTNSLVAHVSDLAFSTTHPSASISFDVKTLESPSGTTFSLKSGDLSAEGGSSLLLGPGLPLLIAQSNDQGIIPFSVKFSNGSTAGSYKAVVVVSCTF